MRFALPAFGQLRLPIQPALVYVVLVIATTVSLGGWIGQQEETGIIRQSGEVTALYVDSVLAPYLQDAQPGGSLAAEHQAAVTRLLDQTPLGRDVVVFKVWDAGGRVLYSSNPALVGRDFPISHGQAHAWRGEVSASISDLREDENVAERTLAASLLETYSPVRRRDTGSVVAVAELYQPVGQLELQASATRTRSWLLVLAASSFVHALLITLARRGQSLCDSCLDEAGPDPLRPSAPAGVQADTDLDTSARMRQAATKSILLHEDLLRQVSEAINAEPIQELGLALLLLDTVSDAPTSLETPASRPHPGSSLTAIHGAVLRTHSALRGLSADLSLPDLEGMTVGDAVAHAVRAHERRTGSSVWLAVSDDVGRASLPVRAVLYRFIVDVLSTLRRRSQRGLLVIVTRRANSLLAEVSDLSTGVDNTSRSDPVEQLRLAEMRVRVESLGGHLDVRAPHGRDVRIVAELPLPPDYQAL